MMKPVQLGTLEVSSTRGADANSTSSPQSSDYRDLPPRPAAIMPASIAQAYNVFVQGGAHQHQQHQTFVQNVQHEAAIIAQLYFAE